MDPTRDQIDAIGLWLQRSLPEAFFTSTVMPDREVVLFRGNTREPRAQAMELEITFEAFLDHSSEQIVTDLGAADLPGRFLARPGQRLIYDRRRQINVAPDTR